ncbi:MAG: hypothetical protein CSB34_04720 [Desulfobulbus propionicus]|nr:MAG: hypothetical protein CSB34_04720 [Desulfobulbus propionicus]
MASLANCTKKKVLVLFGLTASGKSYLGDAFSRKHQIPYYNTDRVRKQLAGLNPTDARPCAVGKGIYSAEYTTKTYQEMVDRASRDLQQGHCAVLLDGSYSGVVEREAVANMARENEATVEFVFCTCPQEVVKQRLDERAADENAVSDGRWEIYQYQLQTFAPPELGSADHLTTLDTNQSLDQLIKVLETLLVKG